MASADGIPVGKLIPGVAESSGISQARTEGPSTSRTLLEFSDVGFAYVGGPPVLDSFSLTVRQGEFVSLLGPSGCGKSTVMSMAAGLLMPQAGTVRFNGRAVNRVNTEVGYMTQDDTLLPWKDVFENVLLALRLGAKKAATQAGSDQRALDREKVLASLTLLALRDSSHKYPAQLSGGMKRRALMARSLIQDPAMLLMDEPFGALDAQLAAELQKEFRSAVESLGQTNLFITHDIAESVLISDRVVVMGVPGGRVVGELEVPAGAGRNLDDFRFSPEFGESCRHLRDLISDARDESIDT